MPRRTTLPAKSWMKTRSGINMLLPWWGGPQVAKHETPREFYGRFLIYIGKKILKKTSSNHWYGWQVWPSHKLTRPPSRTLKFGLKIVSIFSKLLLWSSIYRLICCCSTFMWSVSRSWGQIFEAFLFLLQNCLVLLNNCLIKAWDWIISPCLFANERIWFKNQIVKFVLWSFILWTYASRIVAAHLEPIMITSPLNKCLSKKKKKVHWLRMNIRETDRFLVLSMWAFNDIACFN